MRRLMSVGVFVVVFAAGAMAQQPVGTAGTAPVVIAASEARWSPAPDALPAGAEVAVLDGDPTASGGLFTIRLKVPDGYRVAPHWHPTDETVTVVQGTMMMGMGDKFDETSLKPVGVGGFAKMPQRMNHYVVSKGETVIQISGQGPFVVNYVNPADDPRSKR